MAIALFFGRTDVALRVALDPEDFTCEQSVLVSYLIGLLGEVDDMANYNSLINDFRVDRWLYFATLWYNDGGADNVFGNSTEQTADFQTRFLNMESWEPEESEERIFLRPADFIAGFNAVLDTLIPLIAPRAESNQAMEAPKAIRISRPGVDTTLIFMVNAILFFSTVQNSGGVWASKSTFGQSSDVTCLTFPV
jgi:hypothetical protein